VPLIRSIILTLDISLNKGDIVLEISPELFLFSSDFIGIPISQRSDYHAEGLGWENNRDNPFVGTKD
jgi:hypothetical protein